MAEKVFVTGIYGSGKTTLARSLAAERGVPHLKFDGLYDYKKRPAAVGLLDRLPADFVLDAVPFDVVDGLPDYSSFREYCSSHEDVSVLWKVIPREGWENRTSGRACDEARWVSFHAVLLPAIARCSPCGFRSDSGEVPREEALDMIGFSDLVRQNMLTVTGGYDWKYQAVPELGIPGYSGTPATWAAIKNLLPDVGGTSGRRFIDVGCNHGYVSFRLEEEGASCVGLDSHRGALNTARAVAFMQGFDAEFSLWEAATDPVPEADCTLVLNCLHHFGDAAAPFLDRVRSPFLVSELRTGQVPLVEERFEIVRSAGSKRRDRVVLSARRRTP